MTNLSIMKDLETSSFVLVENTAEFFDSTCNGENCNHEIALQKCEAGPDHKTDELSTNISPDSGYGTGQDLLYEDAIKWDLATLRAKFSALQKLYRNQEEFVDKNKETMNKDNKFIEYLMKQTNEQTLKIEELIAKLNEMQKENEKCTADVYNWKIESKNFELSYKLAENHIRDLASENLKLKSEVSVLLAKLDVLSFRQQTKHYFCGCDRMRNSAVYSPFSNERHSL